MDQLSPLGDLLKKEVNTMK